MKLGIVIQKYQWALNLTDKALAKEIGVAAPVLGRLTAGKQVSDVSLGLVLVWLLKSEA